LRFNPIISAVFVASMSLQKHLINFFNLLMAYFTIFDGHLKQIDKIVLV
jgi:hypothetical protein